MYGGVGRSVSQLLLRPDAPNIFWIFLRHIATFLDYLGGVDIPVRSVLNWANLSKYMGSGEINISASIFGPHAPNFFRSF